MKNMNALEWGPGNRKDKDIRVLGDTVLSPTVYWYK